MTLVYRKLALLEESMKAREEEARINGYTDNTIDKDFQNRLTNLMEKVRLL